MTLGDLLRAYAEYNTMQFWDVEVAYNEGEIDKFDLMDAWLEWNGFIGYGYKFRSLFKLMEDL